MEAQAKEEIVYVASEFSEEDEPPSTRQKPKYYETDHYALANLQHRNTKIPESVIGMKSQTFRKQHFPQATDAQWNDWRWQIRNSITTLEQLQQVIALTNKEIEPISDINNSLPLRITPYYASLLDRDNPLQAIRRSVVPTADELRLSEGEASDPLSEEEHSPVPNLVHRYPDRVLFLVTGFCSAYCRYCTRSHIVAKEKSDFNSEMNEHCLEYIRNHPEVRDVLISGGDAFTMTDAALEYLLSELHKIEHIEIIRIGTKVPAVLPQRITKEFTEMLRKYHPLWLSIHFTHPDEITPEVVEACNRLADAGIPLGSQTVLLKGVNDDVETMKTLMHKLLRIRVRPYYIYQCDPILGSAHFRTPVEKGLEIIRGLRGHTTGYAVPNYVIDAPGGGGKIPLLPEYYVGREGNNVVLRNFEGKTFNYPDVVD